MAFARIQHAGGAITSALNADIASSDTSLVLTTSTGWPDGSVGPFYLVIDPGTAAEEKIEATSRSTNTLSGLTRGVDGTTAAAHSAGAVIQHIFTAVEADEANKTSHSTMGAVTTKGDLLVATGSQALTRLAAGVDGNALIANSGATNGLNYATLGVNGGGTGRATITSHAILVGNGTSAVSLPTVGTNGQLLIGQSSADPSFNTVTGDITIDHTGLTALSTSGKTGQTLPVVRTTNSASQSIPDTTPTALTFDTNQYDPTSMHSVSSNTSRITFATAGYYLVGANLRFAQNNAGYRQIVIELNGTTNLASETDTVFVTTGTDIAVSTGYKFTANDYVRVIVVQTSGGALNVSNVGSWSPQFWAAFQSA